jgi:hypothetical protein
MLFHKAGVVQFFADNLRLRIEQKAGKIFFVAQAGIFLFCATRFVRFAG